MKTIEEFLSFTVTFPTAIADAIGNGWTAEEVYAVAIALQKSQGIDNVPYIKRTYGALNPSYHLQ